MNRVLVMAAAVAVAACSGVPSFSARVISTVNTIGTGEQRVLVELRNGAGEPFALDSAPDATLRDENGSPLGVYPGELVWVVPETQPAYVFVVEVPEPETYQLTIDGGELGVTAPAGLVAVDTPIQVVAGQPAPPIEDVRIAGPALIVFASPDRCPSQSCRPMIDQIEEAADGAGVTWQVVEVFANPDVEDDADLELSPDVEEWGLPSQPWLYAVDASGTVVALYEGTVSDDEVDHALGLIQS